MKKLQQKNIVMWIRLGALLLGVLTLWILNKYQESGSLFHKQTLKMEVSALKLIPETVSFNEELPGRVIAYQTAEIRPQVSGVLTKRLFQEGGVVKESQQLYQINPSPYAATYNSTLADLKKAKANVKTLDAKHQRYKELVRMEAVSKQDYDDIKASLAQAQADVSIAKAAVERAKIDLDYTKVYAPISGRIGKSSVTKGALVTASQPNALATITQLDPVYVDMPQSSVDLLRLRRKTGSFENIPVTLLLDEGKAVHQHEGKIQFHEVTVDQTTDSVQLRALFPNPEYTLLPGLFVRVKLNIQYPDALLVPQNATQRQPDGSLSVWMVDKENIVHPTIIQSDLAIGDKWLISSGLKAGDTIAVAGIMNLKPGTQVTPKFTQNTQTIPVQPLPKKDK